MSEIDAGLQQIRNIGREVGFIRGMELASTLARRDGHTALAERFLELCMQDGLVHLDRDARIRMAESITR